VLWQLHQNVWILHPKFWWQKDYSIMTILFPENFLPKTTWLLTPTHATHLTWPLMTFLCFPNWRYRHLDTTEVIKAKSQVVLNTLRDHNF
jgi:hypothetical protein